ncbi:hypothetical protein [Allosphingosinicella deserti]|uniref:Squalene cyclase C-terminal domain-containing protein n=1 Tax=Allosphingosinicella deserti TaxID=2116704 RepID=A0A2P7QNU6_9SPHN|nr:hypothetical protein [Sphingomonas deserti]PSJ39645.1 hypothetical protein C7I55_13695 [Sphingomonas deserti]
MSTGAELDGAIARGVAFLAEAQCASGELPVFASTDPKMETGCTLDPSIFPTALMAQSLGFCPEAAPVRERALAFLHREMDANGLWRHWTREHPFYAQLPPDLDDTSCASAALASADIAFPDNRSLLLSNRDLRSRFFTWISPRPRLTKGRHLAVTAAQLRHAVTLFFFYRRTSAKPYDVDAVVNANTLFYLGDFPRREAVAAMLLDVLRGDGERSCDKWYDNPFAIWYFFSRALAPIAPEAEAIVARKILSADPETTLDRALAACALLWWGRQPAPSLVDALLASPDVQGSWPRAALYHGGRQRRKDGVFADPHPDTPRWGSEALTTCFCLEALSRVRADVHKVE